MIAQRREVSWSSRTIFQRSEEMDHGVDLVRISSAGPSDRSGAFCASPKKTKRAAEMSPSIPNWSILRTIASNLVIVSTVSPRLIFTSRAASFMKISLGVG